jgi:MFS family permease
MSLPSPQAGGQPLSYFELFKITEFRRYWISQMVSCIGDRLDQMAVFALILRSHAIEATEKGGATAMIFVFATLPYVLVTPLAGGLTDRVDRKKLMMATDIYRGLVVLIAAFLYTVNLPIWYYYICVFLSGCGTAIFGPCKLSFIPQLVPARGLVKGNSVSSMTGTLGTLIGTYAGGAFIAWMAGPLIPIESLDNAVKAMSPEAVAAYGASATQAARWLLLVDAATFAFSFWMLWRVAMPKGNLPYYLNDHIRKIGGEKNLSPEARELVEAASAHARQPYFADFAESFRYCRLHGVARRQLVLTGLVWLIVGVAYAGANIRGINVLGANEEQMGIVLGILGASMFAGCLVVGLGQRWFKPRLVTSVAMLLLAASATLPLLATHWTHLLLAFIPTGIVAGVVIISIDSVYQLTVPNRLRGRMFAANYIVVNFFLIIGMASIAQPGKSAPELYSSAAFYAVSVLAVIGAAMVWFGAIHLMGYKPGLRGRSAPPDGSATTSGPKAAVRVATDPQAAAKASSPKKGKKFSDAQKGKGGKKRKNGGK